MYAILRTKKIKSLAALHRSAKHTFREQPTPNAVPSKTKNNRFIGPRSADALLSSFAARLPQKRRKDAVLCIEYLITASPEAFVKYGGKLDDMGNGYFQDAIAWLRERHGNTNVVSSVVHLDETTPHLVAYVLPLTSDGRLSARSFLGGAKCLRDMQDSFHAHCGARQGLARGVKGSKAKHDAVSCFYTELARRHDAPKLSAVDYAAKAVGVETLRWKEAVELTASNLRRAAIALRKRKPIQARAKALERAEQRLARRNLAAADREHELSVRESNCIEHERQTSSILSQLNAERSRADSLERFLGKLHISEKLEGSKPRDYELDINLRR